MVTNLLMLFFLLVSTELSAMDIPEAHEEQTEFALVVPSSPLIKKKENVQPPVLEKDDKSCSRKKFISSCLCGTAAIAGIALIGTILYMSAHPPQECNVRRNVAFLNESDTTNIEGSSIDIHLDNCGICATESMFCVLPVPDKRNPREIHEHVRVNMHEVCGEKATYRIKQNVAPESDFFAPFRLPSDSGQKFRDFESQKRTIENSCKVSKKGLRSKGKPQIYPKQKFKKSHR